MNMKTLSILLVLISTMNAFAEYDGVMPGGGGRYGLGAARFGNPFSGNFSSYSPSFISAPPPSTTTTVDPKIQQRKDYDQVIADGTASTPQKCTVLLRLSQGIQDNLPTDKESKQVLHECLVLKTLSGNKQVGPGDKDAVKKSGNISCSKPNSYTKDFEQCEKAVNYYMAVVAAESAMNLQQQVRTDLKNQSIGKKAQAEMANGQSQTSMFDAASETNKHQKNMQQEKMIAYSAAVAALVVAYRSIPTIGKISDEFCPQVPKDAQAACPEIMQTYKGGIASNAAAKDSLMAAIMDFTAKGVAAGIAMGQYGNTAKQIDAAKASIQDDQTDMMMEACVLNPTDPACSKTRNRVAGQSITSGDFGAGDMGATNAFNLGGESEVTPEMGGETNLDETAPIAGVNSPFVDDAKLAKGILDPAGAAQMQATGGAAGGGGGAGGGMGGGGSASLGGDLNGANKDGDKEAQIKTNKVSGTYSQGSGGGYKGVGKSKDDANPFASLFDAKGNGGGVEEDRSIASGDIDGASSGLFQKISKRYNQIQADKRIEAKNLE